MRRRELFLGIAIPGKSLTAGHQNGRVPARSAS
jgi:hypothetical protein